MKRIIIAMAAIAAAFSMASCNKELLVEHDLTTVTGNDIITAYTESGLTKTSLEADDWDDYDVVWSEGDEISIGGNKFVLTEGAGTKTGKFRGTLPTEDGTYTACYPATYNNIDWPTSQNYAEDNITGSPMTAAVTVSGGKLSEESLSFKNAGGILRLTVKGTATIKYIKVKADGLDEITLDCGGKAELKSTGTDFHIAMPEGSYPDLQVSIYTPNYDDYCFKKLKPGRNFQIKPSEITRATFTANFPSPTSNDPLSGVFTVSSSKQVRFSKGNLRYSVASREWSFFDKQYKHGPLNTVDQQEISLFTWGYNATKSIDPTGKHSDNVSIESGDLSQAQDWGSVFGEQSPWRTLTSAEWSYLLEGRSNAAEKYGYATVAGQKGLIILPDVFTDPMKNDGSKAFKPQSSTTSWTGNVYTLGGNWEAMELAGAVFLPAAGRRNGSSIATGSDVQGHYWSSSANDSENAQFIYFNDKVNPVTWSRSAGCSVRLVTSTKFTVTFDRNDGSVGDSKTIDVLFGSLISRPTDIFAEIELVAGWYKDKTCTRKWDFDTEKVTSNITLYAKWEKVIGGKFTVNDKGKKVYFTRSNVWADESENLHFEDNQWGFNNKYESIHISHFFWYEHLSEAIRGGDPDQHDFFFCNEKDKVSVDGSDKLFYALSDKEWEYLLEKRVMTYSKPRYTTNITYNGQKGVVIYEDNYVSSPLSDAIDYTEETLGFGCVFLPGAGWRVGETVKPVGDSNGFYWTSGSSITIQDAEFLVWPYFLQVNSAAVQLSDPSDANYGMSLRLVANVE